MSSGRLRTAGVAGAYCSNSKISSRQTTAPGVQASFSPTGKGSRLTIWGMPPRARSRAMFRPPRNTDRPPVSNARFSAAGFVRKRLVGEAIAVRTPAR